MICERNYGCRMMEYAVHGHRAVSMENRFLRIGILPGWGCQVYEFLDKQTDVDFMLRERRGLSRLNGYAPSQQGPQGVFWDYMIGGWFEMLPNAGKACVFNHVTYGQHGEVAYQPWDMEVVSDTPERIALRFTVETMRTDFRLTRVMEMYADRPAVMIHEELLNQSPKPQEYIWGHHFTMGEAFLNSNCVIDAPDCCVLDRCTSDAPFSRLKPGASGRLDSMPGKNGGHIDETRILDRDSHVAEMLYLKDMKAHWLAARDVQRGVGVGLCWDGKIYPSAWIWKEFCANEGFPFYGRCYGLSFEPCVSSVPMLKQAGEAGESQILEGGGKRMTWLTAAVHHSTRKVRNMDRSGHFEFEGEITGEE